MQPNGENYLGAKLFEREIEGTRCWSINPTQYVTQSWKNVEEQLKKRIEGGDNRFARPGSKNNCLITAKTPLPSDYHPEIDTSDELSPTDAAHYQSLIGILRWIVELGRVDIVAEVSIMSSCLALPREDHLRKLFQIFGYLKSHANSELVLDPYPPLWWDEKDDKFPRKDWTGTPYFTGESSLKCERPHGAPAPLGQTVIMSAFCDSDHAGCKLTRRSRTGFLVYIQNSLIHWFSKKQGSVETSTFGSEFVAKKQCTEYIKGLKYKLSMMGIPYEHCCYVFSDNQSVLVNSSEPDSRLKKKSNSIAYHFVREGTTADEWRVAYIPTDQNVADLLTKALPNGEKRTRFIKMILHHL